MSKTIKQIADELGVSKQAVTKCIDNLGLRSTLTKNANYFEVGDSQEKAIKAAFKAHSKSPTKSPTKNDKSPTNANQTQAEFVAVVGALQTMIDTLQGQLAAKDEQIKGQLAQIEQLTAALQQQTAALESTTAALTAAQALHAADKKTLLAIEDNQNPPKRHWWQRKKGE